MNEKEIYKASYMQNPFNILTQENLDRLEKHCKKAIHYERKEGLLEHQLTLDLLYKYRDQQAELEKKDKMIDEMALNIATNDSNLCQYIDETIRCKKYAGENKLTCDECIKQYFERKVEE